MSREIPGAFYNIMKKVPKDTDNGNGAFVRTSPSLLLDKRLRPVDIYLYQVLKMKALGGNRVEATKTWMKDATGLSGSSISRCLAALRDSDLIWRTDQMVIFNDLRNVYGDVVDMVPVVSDQGVEWVKKRKRGGVTTDTGGVTTDTPVEEGGVTTDTGGCHHRHGGVSPQTPRTKPKPRKSGLISFSEDEGYDSGPDRATRAHLKNIKKKRRRKESLPTVESDSLRSPHQKTPKSETPRKAKAAQEIANPVRGNQGKSRAHTIETQGQMVVAPAMMNLAEKVESVSARSSSEHTDLVALPKTAAEVFYSFCSEVKSRWPDARFASMAAPKDLKRVKTDVMCHEPDNVVEMIKILVWDWEVVRKSCWPKQPNRPVPAFENLWRYAADLSSAIGKGFTDWDSRSSSYANRNGGGYPKEMTGEIFKNL